MLEIPLPWNSAFMHEMSLIRSTMQSGNPEEQKNLKHLTSMLDCSKTSSSDIKRAFYITRSVEHSVPLV